MSEPTIETLAQRLDHLERNNRRLKWSVILVFVGVFAVLAALQQGSIPHQVIKANEIQIRYGPNGKTAIWITAGLSTAGIHMYYPNGLIGVALDTAYERSSLTLYNTDVKGDPVITGVPEAPCNLHV